MGRLALALTAPYLVALAFAAVTGFFNPMENPSSAGKATCVIGSIRVTAQAFNTHLLYDNPANQSVLTNTINEFLTPGGSFLEDVQGGLASIQGTYDIHSKLCLPHNADTSSIRTIQFLTHGGSLTSLYWDIAQGNSYVDAAAAAGYATFSYDRIGSGQSDRPDPIQVVQGSLQVEIMHQLVEGLRTGAIGGHAYETVISVSHSLGCPLIVGQVNRYPKDFDALVLTGISTSYAYMSATLVGAAYVPAAIDSRFSNLPNGYILYTGPQAVQLIFFKFPYYDEDIFNTFVTRRDTTTIGEFLTVAALATPSEDFTGPVYVVNGEADYPFCGGNCTFRIDVTASVTPTLFPAVVVSDHYNVPRIGHNIFAHDSNLVFDVFDKILGFLKTNSLDANTGWYDSKQEL